MLCKAIPEPPYDGAVITKKYDELMSQQIICSVCLNKIENNKGFICSL